VIASASEDIGYASGLLFGYLRWPILALVIVDSVYFFAKRPALSYGRALMTRSATVA
jgi:hypothetical protein